MRLKELREKESEKLELVQVRGGLEFGVRFRAGVRVRVRVAGQGARRA